MIQDEVLQEFIDLWTVAPKIDDLKPMEDQNYRMFKKKSGNPVALASSEKHLYHLPHCEDYFDFFNESKIFWVIPCDNADHDIYGFVLRAFKEKKYSMYRPPDSPQLLYGFHEFEKFSYGDPIVLVESAKCCTFIQSFYPYTLALLTDGLSFRSFMFLKQMTDKFVIALDNDDSGKENALKLNKSFRKHRLITKIVYPKMKDWADSVDGHSPLMVEQKIMNGVRNLDS